MSKFNDITVDMGIHVGATVFCNILKKWNVTARKGNFTMKSSYHQYIKTNKQIN